MQGDGEQRAEAEGFETPRRQSGSRRRLDRQASGASSLLVVESCWIIDLGSGLILDICLSICFGSKVVAVGVQGYTAGKNQLRLELRSLCLSFSLFKPRPFKIPSVCAHWLVMQAGEMRRVPRWFTGNQLRRQEIR